MDEFLEIFPTPDKLAEKFAEEMVSMITQSVKKKKFFSVALSGGSTPELLFSAIGEHFPKSSVWKFVHFFWGDEDVDLLMTLKAIMEWPDINFLKR